MNNNNTQDHGMGPIGVPLSPDNTRVPQLNIYDPESMLANTYINPGISSMPLSQSFRTGENTVTATTFPPSTTVQASIGIPLGATPQPPNLHDGDIWYDSTLNTLIFNSTRSGTQKLNGTQGFVNYPGVAYISGTSEVSIGDPITQPGLGSGPLYPRPGQTFSFKAKGIMTTTTTTTLTINIYIGGQTPPLHVYSGAIASTGTPTILTGFTNVFCMLDVDFSVCNQTGPGLPKQVVGAGYFGYLNGSAMVYLPITMTASVDLLPSAPIDLTGFWGANGNTVQFNTFRYNITQ